MPRARPDSRKPVLPSSRHVKCRTRLGAEIESQAHETSGIDMHETTPTNRKRGRPSARTKILDATLELVGDIGVPAITLDGVAIRAGVSKGGLLYHFRFKEQLLAAANEHLVRRR